MKVEDALARLHACRRQHLRHKLSVWPHAVEWTFPNRSYVSVYSLLLYVNALDKFDFRLVATVALAANNEGRASQNREEIQLATDRRGAQ